jgi:hypothetical protein
LTEGHIDSGQKRQRHKQQNGDRDFYFHGLAIFAHSADVQMPRAAKAFALGLRRV